MFDQVSLRKDNQTYVFRYSFDQREQLIEQVRQMASDPACPLDQFDVTCLAYMLNRRSRAVTGTATAEPDARMVRRMLLEPSDAVDPDWEPLDW